MNRLNIPGQTFIYVDTLRLARQKIKGVKWHKLPILKKYLKLEYDSHLAEDDCYVCHEVYKYCRGLTTNEEDVSTFTINQSETSELHNNTLINEPKLVLLIEQAKHCKDEGNLDDAIKLYEKCIALQYQNSEPYDHLILLYRKKRLKEDEIRVLELAIKLFKTDDKYQLRLDKILSK